MRLHPSGTLSARVERVNDTCRLYVERAIAPELTSKVTLTNEFCRDRLLLPHGSPMSKIIDAWTHIFPAAYFQKLQSVASASGPLKRWMNLRSLHDLEARFRLMDQFDDYSQIITPSMPPVEELGNAEEAA